MSEIDYETKLEIIKDILKEELGGDYDDTQYEHLAKKILGGLK